MSVRRFAVRKDGSRIPLAPEAAWSPCWATIRAKRKARARAARISSNALRRIRAKD